jgi:transposase
MQRDGAFDTVLR